MRYSNKNSPGATKFLSHHHSLYCQYKLYLSHQKSKLSFLVLPVQAVLEKLKYKKSKVTKIIMVLLMKVICNWNRKDIPKKFVIWAYMEMISLLGNILDEASSNSSLKWTRIAKRSYPFCLTTTLKICLVTWLLQNNCYDLL